MTTVVQGRTATLVATWAEYPGGPGAAVEDVEITIQPIAGSPIVGPTETDVLYPGVGVNAFEWETAADLASGDYLITWTGQDAQAEEVTATEIVTVLASPVAGSHASVVELVDHIGSTPANAPLLLVRASRAVDQALLTSVYDVDDQVVQDALKLATLEQVAAGLDAGDRSGFGGSTPAGFTLGKLSVQKPSGGNATRRQVGGLWEQAWMVLQQAGLTGYGPQTW